MTTNRWSREYFLSDQLKKDTIELLERREAELRQRDERRRRRLRLLTLGLLGR